jgi:hypothetical protein
VQLSVGCTVAVTRGSHATTYTTWRGVNKNLPSGIRWCPTGQYHPTEHEQHKRPHHTRSNRPDMPGPRVDRRQRRSRLLLHVPGLWCRLHRSAQGGKLGIWVRLWAPFNEECNGVDPVASLATQYDTDAQDWLPYDGKLPDSQEYLDARAWFKGCLGEKPVAPSTPAP